VAAVGGAEPWAFDSSLRPQLSRIILAEFGPYAVIRVRTGLFPFMRGLRNVGGCSTSPGSVLRLEIAFLFLFYEFFGIVTPHWRLARGPVRPATHPLAEEARCCRIVAR